MGHPVADLISSRARAGSLPGRRPDDAHLALVVEGGAMRAVVTAGMGAALGAHGLVPVFDSVFGTSAGAINGAYLLAGQAELALSIYSEVMNSRDFVDLWRAFVPGRPIIDLDHALTEVRSGPIALDFEALAASDVPLHVVAADLATLETEVFTGFATPGELLDALRASSHLPFFAGEPRPIGGRTFVDGMVNDPIPFRPAFAAGATHALVLLSRPVDAPPPYKGLTDWLVREVALRRYGGLHRRMRTRSERYVADVDYVVRATEEPETTPPVLAVAPRGVEVAGLERDADLLRAGGRAGRDALVAALGL